METKNIFGEILRLSARYDVDIRIAAEDMSYYDLSVITTTRSYRCNLMNKHVYKYGYISSLESCDAILQDLENDIKVLTQRALEVSDDRPSD